MSYFSARLRALLPVNWFPDDAPILDATLAGLATLWAWLYDRAAYVQKQTRIHTATEQWLDLIAIDFLGNNLPRHPAERDDDYRIRIEREILRVRDTRPALQQVLFDLTGVAPKIFEPRRAADTGAYNEGSSLAYNGSVGGYGSLQLPYQVFVDAFMPVTSPTSVGRIGGWGDPVMGYGIGAGEYISLSMIVSRITSADVDNAIVATIPAGTIAWTRIMLPLPPALPVGSGRGNTLRFVSGDVQTQGTPDVSFPTQFTISLWACFANTDQTLSFTGSGDVEFTTSLWLNPNQFGFASAFSGTFTASDAGLRPTPVHVLFSIDFAALVYCMYWNDVARPEDHSQVVYGPGNVLNDGGWSVSNPGAVADIWIDERYVDFTDVANRRKFIAEDGTPVDLGATGQLPFGASPRHFLHLSSGDPPVSFADNLGYAGPWEVTDDPLTLDTNCSP